MRRHMASSEPMPVKKRSHGMSAGMYQGPVSDRTVPARTMATRVSPARPRTT